MQSKFGGGQGNKNSNTAVSTTHHTNQEPRKEELSDWPHRLLAIGTFGNNDLPRENEEIQDANGTASSSPDLSEFTPEEIGKLQKELTKLLSKKPAANKQGEITADLPLDRFLNCPSSLEVDRRLSTTVFNNPDDKDEDIDRTIRVILGRCKDICLDNSKKAIGKKSISFLLKKMFLLRAMLKNKINPQNSSRASSARKLIEPKKGKGKATERKDEEDANGGCKWVKTDSE
ncbi:hypothetical protein Ccrd_015814, partial [Cynara cardunculus var. scolymus]